MNTSKIYNQKFFYVTYKSADNVPFKALYIGNTPEEALENAKKNNPHKKTFKVGKTAYNALGEKY